MSVSSPRKTIAWLLLALVQGVSGCLGPSAQLAPSVAEPNARPARNFTSFAGALRCMDRLLHESGRGTVLISSNGFPDNTKDLDVGADDMLINAISQMNASNRRYVFLDQALLKDFGQLEIVTSRKDEEQYPQIYVRGSISQIDERAVDAGVTTSFDGPSTRSLSDLYFRGTRKLSVISVDMHLVSFPSRRVLTGGSVANSMVVSQRRIDGSITGLISQGTLGIPLHIERVESKSQAVRNLIEVGIIELLGRHSGVPYWTCLETPEVNAKRNEKRERQVAHTTDAARITEAQDLLVSMKLLKSHSKGELDAATRRAVSTFQSRHRLLPNGIVDFDTLEALRRAAKTEKKAPKPAPAAGIKQAPTPAPPKPQTPPPSNAPAKRPNPTHTCPGTSPCDDHYLNLYDYIKNL